MSKIEGYIKKEDRKTILLLCDDIRMHSGIATMAREIVMNTAHRYNWINLGAGIQHPEAGKLLDLSQDINKKLSIDDSSVNVMPNNGYGDPQIIRSLMQRFKPDAIYLFTDPRYWVWLFQMEREIRNSIPMFWLNIWDEYPAPNYNKDFYNSVDLLMGISKQTVNINKLVLGEETKGKIIKYVPHGIDDNIFYPIREDSQDYSKFIDFKQKLFKGKDIEFVVFFNSRNIHRKRPGDVILSYRMFCDKIGPEAYKKCALVMHTAPVDNNGTDLNKVKEALCEEDMNIYFSSDKLTPPQMNLLYNVADVTALISSNEGWGLSLTESMMTGTMIIPNVTGGMQDQCRFTDDKGKWIDFDSNFPSNHRGTYKDCGEWAEPVFPSNISLAGSPPTPYIFDDRCSPEDVAMAIEKIYKLPKQDRDAKGLAGRKWAMSDEAKMTAASMSKNISDAMDEAFKTFKPRARYEVIKSTKRSLNKVNHKIYNY